jgi:hemoglobin
MISRPNRRVGRSSWIAPVGQLRPAFVGYVEWGTRLAVHNSSDADDIVEHAPVPRWGWGVAPPYQP